MPTPQEEAAEGSAAARRGAAEPAAVSAEQQSSVGPRSDSGEITGPRTAGSHPDDRSPPGGSSAGSHSVGGQGTGGQAAGPDQAPGQTRANGIATASLVSGILGVTGVGVVLGIIFGIVGLARSKRRGSGKVRCWIGIVAALLWAGVLIYVVPHVVKAADPGCTSYKETALASYDTAIEDFDARAGRVKVSADLRKAIADLSAAAAKSGNSDAKNALSQLTAQLRKVLADEASGVVPGSAMQALNQDAAAADTMCGTL